MKLKFFLPFAVLIGVLHFSVKAQNPPPSLPGLNPRLPTKAVDDKTLVAEPKDNAAPDSSEKRRDLGRRIFNGKNLSGWTGNPELWSVKDGAIVGQTTAEKPTKHNTFLIWTNAPTGDFELRLQYKIIGGNSGIQYRSKVLDEKNWVVGGYQADFEAGSKYSGILYEEKMTRGIMAERGEKVVWNKECKKEVKGSVGKSDEIQAGIKKEDWNEYVVIANGNHLQHFINGKLTADITDECEEKAAKSGVLALQIHQGPPMTVMFKDIRLKQLK